MLMRVARESFGYTAFRAGQEDAINAVLAGQDSLVILPTGSGKSAIYQIAALLLDGPTGLRRCSSLTCAAHRGSLPKLGLGHIM
jgi:superfamily II DNA helicase RecQ